MRAAPELLGALTIGRRSARPGGGGGESYRSQISLPSRPKYAKMARKQAVLRTFWLINRLKHRFLLKSTLKDIIPRRFLRNTSIKNFSELKPLRRYTCLKFRKSYMPPAARIRVKGHTVDRTGQSGRVQVHYHVSIVQKSTVRNSKVSYSSVRCGSEKEVRTVQ